MYISITCPECGKEIEVDEAEIKRLRVCPYCKAKLKSERENGAVVSDGAQALVYSADFEIIEEAGEKVLTAYRGAGGAVIIPDGVSEMENGVFTGNESITSVVIPSSLKKVGWADFKDCKNLAFVKFQSGVEEVSGRAFEGCENLTQVELPDTLEYLGAGTFEECTKLRYNEFGGGRYLGNAQNPYFAFVDTVESESPVDLAIHSQTKLIVELGGAWERLKSVTVTGGVKKIPANAFSNCPNLQSVSVEEGVEYIGSKAFADCDSLREISLPKSLRVIFSDSFDDAVFVDRGWGLGAYLKTTENKYAVLMDCDKKQNPLWPKSPVDFEVRAEAEVIAWGAFYKKDRNGKPLNWRKITVGDNVHAISSGTFWGLEPLKKVVLGRSLNYIGSEAFLYCKKLAKIEFQVFDGWTADGEPIDPKLVKNARKMAKLLTGDWKHKILRRE
ncbi:MAG: leucine-rich repeat protein [Clostridia bacterium]|nr:leucine-rich repeat protein [Clostridia bacterium]